MIPYIIMLIIFSCKLFTLLIVEKNCKYKTGSELKSTQYGTKTNNLLHISEFFVYFCLT